MKVEVSRIRSVTESVPAACPETQAVLLSLGFRSVLPSLLCSGQFRVLTPRSRSGLFTGLYVGSASSSVQAPHTAPRQSC